MLRTCFLLYAVLGAQGAVAADSPAIWIPAPSTTWQWQITGRVDVSVDAQMYDIDLFDNDASVVERLHARGRRVICYLSAGTFEEWRPDAHLFPFEVRGRALDDWPGERWLDIRRLDVLGPIMEARLDLCKARGFDGVEPDNMDAYSNRSGFPVTAEDQLRYNRFIARAAHARGLSVAMKNDVEQAVELADDFDFAINEECLQYNECGALRPFTDAGKAVFHVEYDGGFRAICSAARRYGFNSLKKRWDLDAWRRACEPPGASMQLAEVRNYASWGSGPLAPGEIIRIPAVLTDGQRPSEGASLELHIGGQAAPLLFAGNGEIVARVPFDARPGTRVGIQQVQGKVRSNTLSFPIEPAAPGVFTLDGSGYGPVWAHDRRDMITARHPARPGSVFTFYATGTGQTNPASEDGALAIRSLSATELPVEVRIGGREAMVEYAGAAPHAPPGLTAIRIRVADGTPAAAAVPLELRVGGYASAPGVTVAVTD